MGRTDVSLIVRGCLHDEMVSTIYLNSLRINRQQISPHEHLPAQQMRIGSTTLSLIPHSIVGQLTYGILVQVRQY